MLLIGGFQQDGRVGPLIDRLNHKIAKRVRWQSLSLRRLAYPVCRSRIRRLRRCGGQVESINLLLGESYANWVEPHRATGLGVVLLAAHLCDELPDVLRHAREDRLP